MAHISAPIAAPGNFIQRVVLSLRFINNFFSTVVAHAPYGGYGAYGGYNAPLAGYHAAAPAYYH